MTPVAVGTLMLIAITGTPYLLYTTIYAIMQPTGSSVTKTPSEPTASVILPTYNEADIVESKLEDICDLDYPLDKIELVVVDASEDETARIISDFFADRQTPTLTLIREEDRRGLASALNDAYEVASKEIVIKTDCDSRLANDALREAAANLADPNVAGVTGRNADVLGGSSVEEGYRDIQAQIQVLESHLDSTLIFHGPFSAFENDVIVPIDPDSLADDTELALKIRRQGKRVIFDPAIRYQEAAQSKFLKRRKQKDRRARGLIKLLVQHRDALFSYGKYGWIVLPFNWWFMIISPWLLAVTAVGATAAAISSVGPVGIFLLAGIFGFIWLGGREVLGPFQPIHSILDTQISLGRAGIALLRGGSDGTWEIDEELRESYN